MSLLHRSREYSVDDKYESYAKKRDSSLDDLRAQSKQVREYASKVVKRTPAKKMIKTKSQRSLSHYSARSSQMSARSQTSAKSQNYLRLQQEHNDKVRLNSQKQAANKYKALYEESKRQLVEERAAH